MIVLGIDCARTSGWCIMRRTADRLSSRAGSGVVTRADQRAEVIQAAIRLGTELGERLAVVYERHTVGGGARWTPDTMMGMGEARGRWLEQLELAGVPRSHIIGVRPATWRAATLPPCGRDRAALKAAAVASCRARGWPVESDDEAEACLIAWWGTQASAEVRSLATRRRAA